MRTRLAAGRDGGWGWGWGWGQIGPVLIGAALAGCQPTAGDPPTDAAQPLPMATEGLSGANQSAVQAGVSTGKAVPVRFDSGVTVSVQEVAVKADGNARCAVRLTEAGSAPQTIVTIGAGETEALTCGSLKALGRVPAPPGMQRIAFLYEAFGPHSTVLQPVILFRSAPGANWTSDDALAQRIGEDGSLVTIPAIRRFLESSVSAGG